MKVCLSIEELIQHLEDKGISFNLMTKEDAKIFLTEQCYYFKVAAYRENYDKDYSGKYKNLDFAYLAELSKLDKHLRYIIMDLCLDIEHSLKNKLLQDITTRTDGYEPINKFLNQYTTVKEKLNSHKSSSYTQSLIEKYEDNYPCWVFFEIISFGDLTKFCHFYYNEYHVKVIDSRLLNNVRDLRNAAAHNNCLIKNLRIGNNIPLTPISNFVKNITTINKATRQRKLTNKFLYDFVVLIYVHNLIVSDNDKFNKLIDFLNNRILNNKSYFENVPLFKSSYDFIKKIVDYLLSL